MADIFNKEKRSQIMSRIKNRNTKPELIVRKFLHSKGFRFRVNDKSLPGTPDIKLTKYKVVIFVNGCFWHRHEGCRYCNIPKSNVEFWVNKIGKNVHRDKIKNDSLANLGWKVLVIWECQLKRKVKDAFLLELINAIKK